MDAFVKRIPKTQDTPVPTSPTKGSDGRSRKRVKREEIADSESDDLESFSAQGSQFRYSPKKNRGGNQPQQSESQRITEIETALLPTGTDEGAIEEYEAYKASQSSVVAQDGDNPEQRWIKGRSSIYVDAFNLALDTVLEEESPLFNSKELEVFKQWKELDYEVQYLYVRLFLRKAASWHRSSRLGYHSDVSNLDAAIESLQMSRGLPEDAREAHSNPLGELDLEEYRLGDSFTFADCSQEYITTVETAAPLLQLDELKALAKEAKVQGRNKAELIKALCRMSKHQTGLVAMGLSRHNSRDSSASTDSEMPKSGVRAKLRREDSNREQHFLGKIRDIIGPCVRLSPTTFKLFERVHLVFYRSTEWTEKSLTTIILAKIARRNFPEYLVCRTSTIFASRLHLVEFESAIRLEAEVDNVLEFNGPPGEEGFQKIMDVFDRVYPRWKTLVEEEAEKERKIYDMGEGAYLRRFNPAHSYTRIVHKALHVFGRRKEHAKEYGLLCELLDQRLFHLARRGSWYQRKALLEEHYMAALDETSSSVGLDEMKKRWRKRAAETCEAGLQDPDCHLIFHYDLQKRLTKLEKKLRLPWRLQHSFGHVRLADPLQITVEGIQIKRKTAIKPGKLAVSTKTIWLDELDTGGECSVEEMCLSHFRSEGWKGYHAEGGIVRTLFAYLFYDILFLYIPNVFQTAYQTCPLDLHTDAFYPARASEINHRLVEIANGEAERLVRQIHGKESERRPSVVGLNWDFEVEDLVELVNCFEGSALAAICKVMAQEYKSRGGGIPDLVLWRSSTQASAEEQQASNPGKAKGEVMFAEVKSANDRLSDTQRLWIHVLTGAGVKVALCNALAKEVRHVD